MQYKYTSIGFARYAKYYINLTKISKTQVDIMFARYAKYYINLTQLQAKTENILFARYAKYYINLTSHRIGLIYQRLLGMLNTI